MTIDSKFLESGRYCKWSRQSELTKKAETLKGKTDAATISSVYEYVALGISYDFDKAERLKGGKGYVPDPELTYERKSGVCFDKASLMCAMLRADGIPSKLCIGTVDGESHAWVSAFDGSRWLACDPTLFDKSKKRKYETIYQM